MADQSVQMAPIKVPANLPGLVRSAFVKAKASGDLMHFPTQVSILQAGSVPFQLRFAPSLASKPKGPSKPEGPSLHPAHDKASYNPFLSPPPALFITRLEPPSHYLVLNKFAITQEHFILATSAFKPQTHLLEADDLAACLACIRAYRQAGEELFAFFNSGKDSGASQPHRHIQLLPVARMKEDVEDNEWDVLAKTMKTGVNEEDVAEVDNTPFRAFATRISLDTTPEELHSLYIRLYQEARRTVDAYTTIGDGTEAEKHAENEAGAARISYNLAMTESALVIAPRLAEGGPVFGADGLPVGMMGLNGTVLAGTALVKSQAEWDAIRNDPGQLLNILCKIGVPAGTQGDGKL